MAMRLFFCCLLCWLGLCLETCRVADPVLFVSEPELLFDGGKLTEGPAVDTAGNLYFSDQPNDIIRRLTPEGRVETVRKPSGVTNGLAFDHQGRLLMCQSNSGNYPDDPSAGGRRIVRLEKDSTLTVLADQFEGQPFIAPNDLCTDQQGNIYFTDPYYPGPLTEKSQPVSGVYRITPSGEVTRVIAHLQKPNGILMTPDNRTLYVSDRGTQQLHRYQVRLDGRLQPAGVVFKFPGRGIDGMALDTQGNIYGAAGEGVRTGVYVIDPLQRQLLSFQPFPETTYNVCFGGPDQKTLYVCSGGSVYRMKTKHAGWILPIHQ